MDLTKYVGKTLLFTSRNFEGKKATVDKISYDTKYIYGVAMLATLEDGNPYTGEGSERA